MSVLSKLFGAEVSRDISRTSRKRRPALAVEALEARTVLSHLSPGSSFDRDDFDRPPGQVNQNTNRFNQLLVAEYYQVFLGRDVESNGLAFWTDQLARGASYTEVSDAIANSSEATALDIQDAYNYFLFRDPTQSDIAFWQGYLSDGNSDADLISSIIASPEYYDISGGTDQGFIDQVYFDVLGRTPDTDGNNFFLNNLDSGRQDRFDVAQEIFTSPESRAIKIDAGYQGILGRSAEQSGIDFWQSQDVIASQLFYSDLLASQENLGRTQSIFDVSAGLDPNDAIDGFYQYIPFYF